MSALDALNQDLAEGSPPTPQIVEAVAREATEMRLEIERLREVEAMAIDVQNRIRAMRRDPVPGNLFPALYNWLDRFDALRERMRKR